MKQFILNNENYYSQEANAEYMSVSQWKDFHGSPGLPGCTARALEKMNGTYKEEPSDALLIGSYVDSYFEGTLEEFAEEHPEIYTKASYKKFLTDGTEPTLLAKFKHANKMIKRCERDQLFMGYMAGDKQTIMTAEMFGAKWKIKIDSYIEGSGIIDLKTSQNFRKIYRIKDSGQYMTFVDYFGYVHQLAVYQEVVRINTGLRLPCFIAVVSKQAVPDIEIIHISDKKMKIALSEIEASMPYVLGVKSGDIPAIKCDICDYCKERRVLTKAIEFEDLLVDVT